MDADSSFLCTNLINIRYLTGFTGSNALVLVTHDDVHLFTDARYAIQAEQETSSVTITIANDLFRAVATKISSEPFYIEGSDITVESFEKLKDLIPNQVLISNNFVERLRVIKDQHEVAVIEQACEIATNALTLVLHKLHVGQSEREVALILNRTMVDLGADDIAFETIVAAGANSAIPHHKPTERPITQGDLLKIDFGAKLQGYHSDCTRTFVMGKPHSWQQEIHEIVRGAQRTGREALHQDVPCSTVTDTVKSVFDDTNFGQYFTHGLGHGVGLEIHEDPFLSQQSTDTLKSGTIVTIEPGVYLPNQGGVRIEDTVVITPDGYRNLTVFDYDLIEIS